MLVLRADLAVRRNDLRALRGHRIGAALEPGRVLTDLLVQAGIDTATEEIEIVLSLAQPRLASRPASPLRALSRTVNWTGSGLIFFIGQRSFVRGVVMSGIKG
jgi:hypothetical protein